MNKSTVTISLLVLGLLAGYGCSQEQEAPQQQKELVRNVNVQTEVLQPREFERYLRLVGTVSSENDVIISSEVSGRIERYYRPKGAQVQKGENILKIEDSKLLSEKARLEAQTEQAREQYQRLKQVFEEDSIGSEIDIINAKAVYEQSKAALASIIVDLENTTVKAPFDAVLEERMLEVGEMASPGAPLFRLIGSNELKVNVGVPSRFSDVVKKGDKAQVWFEFETSDTLSLPITYVGQSIDPDARTFQVEIALPERTENYKVDMVANVKLRTLHQENALVIGQEYLYQKEGGYVVYTVGQDDEGNLVAKEQPVTVGSSYENRVVIAEGLQAGDELITIGSSFVQNNMRITIVEDENAGLAQRD